MTVIWFSAQNRNFKSSRLFFWSFKKVLKSKTQIRKSNLKSGLLYFYSQKWELLHTTLLVHHQIVLFLPIIKSRIFTELRVATGDACLVQIYPPSTSIAIQCIDTQVTGSCFRWCSPGSLEIPFSSPTGSPWWESRFKRAFFKQRFIFWSFSGAPWHPEGKVFILFKRQGLVCQILQTEPHALWLFDLYKLDFRCTSLIFLSFFFLKEN